MVLKLALTWSAVVIQATAAYLWYRSTVARVSGRKVEEDYQRQHGITSGGPAQMIVDDESGKEPYDFIHTAIEQGKWNARAAIVTGIGVATQAVAAALP